MNTYRKNANKFEIKESFHGSVGYGILTAIVGDINISILEYIILE